MKATFRKQSGIDYWNARWSSAGADLQNFENSSIYPIRYALNALMPNDRILEVGFGSGRILFHLTNLGYDIMGVDISEAAARVVAAADPSQTLVISSVTCLPFADGEFDVVLAFGVVHGIEDNPQNALHEIARVLRKNGRYVVSLRANNVETRINDLFWKVRNRHVSGVKRFHKWRFDYSELHSFFEETGLTVDQIDFARNVPNLFRVPLLRRQDLKQASESVLRSHGFGLNVIGQLVDRLTYGLQPQAFCSIYCVSGKKGQ